MFWNAPSPTAIGSSASARETGCRVAVANRHGSSEAARRRDAELAARSRVTRSGATRQCSGAKRWGGSCAERRGDAAAAPLARPRRSDCWVQEQRGGPRRRRVVGAQQEVSDATFAQRQHGVHGALLDEGSARPRWPG